ncbi:MULTISPECIES: dTDP-4-dehydrorhamnose 3,5-epimerase [unclassified Rhizobium]|uniref:dTDP-4-dehydrorhamnose 3,5-epimerase n=1 Tax=unclassified Rhizobium TaxID=2613769 RepID=UPI0006FAE13E|nr:MULTISPECIES: dTDP-4-dehydrorhamnose 3,5-epimerase [unclassified Rhizobium]KQV36323.1 dTDP-4-dehydrorhamnose 3,5-epimerase [Rhizobium sp. Root1212]KRD26268.1 dTDP-4-dehydrorhamnose 3,5-epimerase [Rhizobium sp. Root268]
MNYKRSKFAGVTEITPTRFGGRRGYFSEVFKDTWFRESVADVGFMQDNQSFSREVGTLRGLHFQLEPFAQGKLVRVLSGSIFDVAADIRTGSPDYGRWVGVILTAEEGNQLWIPPGFAHGFLTLEPDTLIHYKVTAPYSATHDRGLHWNDPSIAVAWPDVSAGFTLSAKDEVQPFLTDLEPAFTYTSDDK